MSGYVFIAIVAFVLMVGLAWQEAPRGRRLAHLTQPRRLGVLVAGTVALVICVLALADVFGTWARYLVGVPLAIAWTVLILGGVWTLARSVRAGWREGGTRGN